MNQKYVIASVIGIVIVVGAVVYFSNNKNSSDSTYTPSNTTATKKTSNSGDPKPETVPAPVVSTVVHNVSISGFAFVPGSLTVRKGETIVWTNKDSAPHTVTGGDLQSLPLAQNQTYSFAYDKTGTFSYHCSLHPSMKGTITVTD